jgi:flagellar hook-basal body complex protein FliE
MMIDAISGVAGRALPTSPVGGMAQPSSVQGPVATPTVKGAAAVNFPDQDFATLLGNAISEFGQTLRQAEAVSIGGVKGTAALQDVVEHVMSAEQSLQAVIAVRDKVVSAYQEISRMAI